MIDAVVYVRVSTEVALEGFGLESQERVARNFSETNAYNVVRVFADEAVKGRTETDRREQYVAMMQYVETHGIKHVIVARLDRIARDLMIQEKIIADFRKAGLNLVSVAEPDLCGDDPTRELLRRFMGAISDWEAKMIMRKLRGGRIERAHQGERAVGAIPIGYKVEKVGKRNVTVVDEPRANLVRSIITMRDRDRMPFARIADFLNGAFVTGDQNAKPPRGALWHAMTVQRIYNNPRYRGEMSYSPGDGSVVTKNNERLVIVK